jgi:hypothetical protein
MVGPFALRSCGLATYGVRMRVTRAYNSSHRPEPLLTPSHFSLNYVKLSE